MSRRAPAIPFILFTVFLDALGIGLLIPVSPKLVEQLLGLPPQGEESQAAWAVGALAATYAAMQFVFSPILGSLSDRFGRRPVILISLFGSGLDYFAGALSPNLAFLFFTRLLNGISGASVSACNAYIADVTPPEKRAGAYGMLYAAFGMGFVFGPLAGGLLGEHDIRYPFYAAGALCIINWVYGLMVLPESLPPERRRAFSWQKANPLGALIWLTHHHVVFTLALTLFLGNLAQFGLHATWVLSMSNRFAWGPREVGWSLFIVGISAAIVQGGLARKIIPRFGERACLIGGLLMGVFAFTGYAFATHGWMVYTIIAIASLGGVAQPALQAIITKAIAPTEQGLLQGSLAGLASIAGIFGPLIGSMVFKHFTEPGAPVHFAGAPFLTGATLVALSLVPVLVMWNKLPKSVEQKPIEDSGAEEPCMHCGYELKGFNSTVCPECGQPVERLDTAPPPSH